MPAKFRREPPVQRPRGSYQTVERGDGFQVKRIVVNPRQRLSLQKHARRSEHWVVVRGTAKVTCGEDVRPVGRNESVYIPKGTAHRLENTGDVALEVVEVQCGDYLGEDDIVRLDDDYGRI